MTQLSVDPDRCVGHGRCYSLAPDVFDADEVGHCVIRIENVSGELEKQAALGAENCPEQAITLSPTGSRDVAASLRERRSAGWNDRK